MYAEGLDRLLEHDLLLRNAQTVLAVELLRDLLGGDCAEQTAACTALGRNLDRALLELFRRLARCLLLERNLACVRLVLRLLYVEVVGGSQLCQTARHEEVAAVALADLDEVALLALALYVCCQNYFHDVYLLLGCELTNLIYGCSFCFSARWSSR